MHRNSHRNSRIPATYLAGVRITAKRILRDLNIPISWDSENVCHRRYASVKLAAPWQICRRICLFTAVIVLIALWRVELTHNKGQYFGCFRDRPWALICLISI